MRVMSDEPSGWAVAPGITIPEAEVEFSAIRSQGAGGQNVNKVASAVQLKFDAAQSTALPPGCRQRLLARRDQRISADGVVTIKAQQFRSQEQNKRAAMERLAELIRQAAVAPRPRKPTKPPRAAHARRLEGKARRGALKRSRRAVDD